MKLISYILSSIFSIVFVVTLLIFHPLQWIGLKISQDAHQKVVDVLNLFLVLALRILGNPVRFNNPYKLPENETLIFVANHQSMFDIPAIIWYLRKHYPKFVSKKELGKGIPSISFNLRYGGACLIDRKDRNQALKSLDDFAVNINTKTWSAVIFPEGTRSRDGKVKDFKFGGLKTIINRNPDAKIVPITINNSWKVFKYGKFPFGIFSPIYFDVHEPISLKDKATNDVLTLTEEIIKRGIR